MSATLIGNNVTLKVSAAVSGSTSSNGAAAYTAPANSYAIVNVGGTGTSQGYSVGGQQVRAAGGVFNDLGVIIGPSQAITLQTGSTGTITVSGVLLTNSP